MELILAWYEDRSLSELLANVDWFEHEGSRKGRRHRAGGGFKTITGWFAIDYIFQLTISTFFEELIRAPMKLQFVLTLVLGSVFLPGCATAPDRPSPEVAARMKRVAVVSIMGREITRSYIGVTVFGNEFHKEDIADWNLDSEYERQLTNAVGVALAGVTVVPDRVNRQAIAKIDVLGRPIQMQSIGAELTVQCVASGVDGILIATRSTDRGIGVWVSRQYNVRELAISASISLFDCSSAKFVAMQPLVEGEPKDFLKIKAPYPRMDLREDWPADGEWSKSTLADVHPYLIKLPEASWPYTVKKLFGQ